MFMTGDAGGYVEQAADTRVPGCVEAGPSGGQCCGAEQLAGYGG